jgi:hypothetical protein
MNETLSGDTPDAAVPPQPVLTPEELAEATAGNPDDAQPPRHPIEHVLLIDGDNDPHVPTDVKPTRHWLVRVFLRPGAKMPRTLEKKLGHLPHCATVVSPKGGANAADFVMSLHAGMLHSVLPSHVPFLMVTNDATLQAMAAELQRLGRIASLWTSHPDANQMSQAAQDENDEEPRPRARSRSRGGRSRGGRSGGRSRGGRSSGGRSAKPSGAPSEGVATREEVLGLSAPKPAAPPPSDEPRKTGGKTLAEVAWTYAARLQRIKDVPSRLKTLLNDIKNRAGSQGFTPEEVLEELKRHHGVRVDGTGKVSVDKVKPAESAPEETPEADA